jgi:hypothetical protein
MVTSPSRFNAAANAAIRDNAAADRFKLPWSPGLPKEYQVLPLINIVSMWLPYSETHMAQ